MSVVRIGLSAAAAQMEPAFAGGAEFEIYFSATSTFTL
jgi:hypothetical protein